MRNSPLIIQAKVKAGVELDDLRKCGFNWAQYDNERGVHRTKGGVTIYSSDRKVRYKKLTQEVLDTILSLCCTGLIVILKTE